MAVLALPSDIKNTGINQDSLVTLLTNYNTVINELVDDHATNKVTIDEAVVAITEMITDHATFKTAVAAQTSAINAIIAAAASGSGISVTTVTASAPATLSAGVPTASAAALTNSTDLTLLKG